MSSLIIGQVVTGGGSYPKRFPLLIRRYFIKRRRNSLYPRYFLCVVYFKTSRFPTTIATFLVKSKGRCCLNCLKPVIRQRIYKFLRHPDPLVKSSGSGPGSFHQALFCTFFYFLSLKNDVNVH